MRVPLRRGRRSVLAGTVAGGLVLAVALTWSSTHAAFSASTANPGNSWQTGSVRLADDQRGTALFGSSPTSRLTPGATGSRCIRLDYTGDVTADIRMYVGTPAGGATSLDDHLEMSVERGTDVDPAAPFTAGCGQFAPATPSAVPFPHPADDPGAGDLRTLADLKTHADYASGLRISTATAPGTSLTLRITYRVEDDAPQSSLSQATFTWEAQNT